MSRPDAERLCEPVALHCEERGSGRPLVILHGLLGSLANWRGIARSLATTFRVVSLDARNHGRSPHDDVHTYEAMAADTAALMESQGLAPAVVVGHSMGGKTAMTLALRRPELVERLVVLDIAPRAYAEAQGPADVVRALAEIDASAASSREEVEARLGESVPDAATRAFLLMNLSRRATGGLAWRCNLDALVRAGADLGAAVVAEGGAAYAGPALFVRGAWSRYVTSSDEDRIAALFPAAELVTLPEAGHWLHVEAPEALLAAISRFTGATQAEQATGAAAGDGSADATPAGAPGGRAAD